MKSYSLYLIILFLSNSLLILAQYLCREDQKDALLGFKNEFYVEGFFNYGMAVDKKTERWENSTNCCDWPGVSCDPQTGMVVELDVSYSFLNGPLRFNSSLFKLQHLQILALNNNNISGVIPDSITKLRNLGGVSLSFCNFFGKIPSVLGNLSHLTHLDLSNNDLIGELPDSMGRLNQLTEIQLVSTKVNGSFPHVLLNLSELTRIDFRGNQFEGKLPSDISSLSKLEEFSVSDNSFSGSIPSSLFIHPSLIHLDLSENDFSGPLEIGNFSSQSKLGSLELADNNFRGPIPRSIAKLVGLWYLDLSLWNTERGVVDFSIFSHLKSLRGLDISYLNTRSVADISVFSHLMSLTGLDISGIDVKVNSNLSFPIPISTLTLSSCNIAAFPKFLQTTTSLFYLDISINQIEGQVPDWLWRLPILRYVNISQNFFSGFEGLSNVLQSSALTMLDISSNTFQDLPLLPISMMFFSGTDNGFSGEIPRSICELVKLDTLVLSNNNFSGSIPRCFENFNTTLSVLHLRNNNLSGTFPEELISYDLRSLDIGGNKLSGQLPKSLIKCIQLEFLNVENNKINDTFPFWLGMLPALQILVLHSNEFHGPIYSPGDSLSFPSLRIFDISGNHFTGILPSDYFLRWNAMSSVVKIIDRTPIRMAGRGFGYYHRSVDMTAKGLNMELIGSGFTIYKSIDVSGNRFQGEIPESICSLRELIVLDLSNNAFTGRIPPCLSNIPNLQSLDLSQNRLSGEIPPELSKLTFLSWMNFSYNKLEGHIPQGTQIQIQNSSSFTENPGLCGLPLIKTCDREKEATNENQDEEKHDKDQVLSWIAAAIAYVPGLVCGIIIGHFTKREWLMRFIDNFT